MTVRRTLCGLTACLAFAACREKAPPAGAIVFQLSAVHPTTADTVGPPFTATDSFVAQGGDTLFLSRARIVLAELAIAPAVSNECEEEEGEDNPPCVEFSDEPVAIDLPLGRTVRRGAERAPPTDYNLFQAIVHPVDPAQDRDLAAAAPDMANSSIRIAGTYSQGGRRRPFVYATPWSEQQEITIEPVLTVTANDSLHVTLRVDVASWFRNADHTGLIDPASAAPGAPNENLVKDNVRLSFKVLRDANADGLEDAAQP
jgi:hypothetical protein